MNALHRFLERIYRRVAPVTYLRSNASRVWQKYELEISQARAANDWEKIEFLKSERRSVVVQYTGPLAKAYDDKLLKTAQQRGIELADVDVPIGMTSYYVTDEWGVETLDPRVRDGLRQLIRKNDKEYRKDRRETWDFRIRLATSLLGSLIGLIGAIIGLIATVKKK